ncbi:T9SS type A sorting domain-containing protein [Flavobacterium sp. PLA-1-15]|uniref:T9SS type A sorting domain-containing protein n=1 Tax=Flavobacterium sp. PLA-1-15 TaxID=3380533 RepID=UPI003B7F5D46
MKKITFCFVLLLLTYFGGQAQVQLGDGTAIEKGVPFEPRNPYSYAQSIYLASEILASGEITSIQWYFAGNGSLDGSQELTIYLGHTSKSAFDSATDWEPIANLTEVYLGDIDAEGAGWITVYLDTPFTYNGTDNLIVAVKEDSEDMDGWDDQFYAYEVEGNRSITYASWSDAVDVENPAEGTLKNFVANVSFDGIVQACPKPTDLIAQDATTNGVVLYWTSNAGATQGSQYYFSTTNTTPTASTEPSGSVASGQSFEVSNLLTSGTVYYVWVRDICENGPGTWSNVTSFVTQCEPLQELIQNFNNATPQTVPVCWTSIVYNPNEDSSPANVSVTNEDGNTGNSVQFYTNGDGDADLILVLPELTNVGDGTHRLRFFAKDASFNAGSTFSVGTLDGNYPGANFTEVEEINVTNTFKEFAIDFTNATGTVDTFVAIRLNSASDNVLSYVDDIRWEISPLCPDVTLIQVPVATTNTATISWTSSEEITQWEVVHSNDPLVDPSSITPILEILNTPTASISNLTAETTYYVWVRSKCEAGNGLWVGPVAFNTACPFVNSLNENFDGGLGEELPTCWSSILRGNSLSLYADVRVAYNDLATSGTTSLELYSGFSGPSPSDDIIAVSPNLGNLSSGTHRIKFFAKGMGTLQIGTLASNTNAADFNFFEQITLSNSEMTEYVIEFSSYEGADTYIGFRYNTTQMFASVYIDDVTWETIPACPDVTEIDAMPLNTTTITLGWNAGDTSNWQTAHGLISITDPNLATVSNVLTNATNEISGLSSNTDYKIWVRSVCGENGNGAWIGPILVKTLCDAVTTFNETFETSTSGLPSCWSSIVNGDISGGAGISVISWQPYAGTKGIEIYNAGSSSTDDIILVSPILSNLSSATHLLKFYAAQLVTAGSLEIGTIDLEGNFNFYEEVLLTTSYEEYTVDFASYTGTDNRIGIRLNSEETYQSIGMDNISWEINPELSNGNFETAAFSLYPNPVKDVINLSYKQNITNVSIFNLLGQKVYESNLDSTSAQINMSGFSSGSYIVKITSDDQTKAIKIIKE